MDNVNRLRVGLFAPDFALKDSEGRRIQLSQFRGKMNVLLFFCKGKKDQLCLAWLDELDRLYDRIRLRETEIFSLTLDERWSSRRLREERKIRFPILKIEADLGIDPHAPPGSQRYGVEIERDGQKGLYSVLFLVDKMGIVRYRRVYTQTAVGPDAQELLCQLG